LGSTTHTGRTVQYNYDITYKLIQESIDDPDFWVQVISYEYDQVGNRLLKVDDGDSTQCSYDANDRLLSENGITYTYDDNGNTLTKSSAAENITYSYVYQNRLIKVDDGVSVVEYAYDTEGNRVEKIVDNVDVTHYLVDNNRNYAQVLQERDGSGAVLVDYTYGGDLISQKRGSLKSYYHYDGQLSTRQLTDASKNITDTYTYDAFGLLLNRSGATENNYLYTGEQYDPNVGFYYLRARYYNQNIGRFLTMDAFPGMQFEPGSLHKYLYCESNPVGRWDASGELTLTETTASIIIGGILGAVGHLIGYFAQPQENREWNTLDFIVSIATGAAGGYLGPCSIASWKAVLINSAYSAFFSSFQYTAHWAWSGDDWNTYAFFLSFTAGAISGLVTGRLGKAGWSSFPRGFAGSFSATTWTSLVNGAKKYLEENVNPTLEKALKYFFDLIFRGPVPWKEGEPEYY